MSHHLDFLDGVSTPTETTAIKSIYKEFRPTTTSSNTVITDGTIIYPNVNSPTSAEFYASGNLNLFTGNLNNLTSIEALTAEVNVIQIQTNTGTYSGFVKSSSSVLRNLTNGGVVDKYVGFWMNGFDIDFTHNGTTNNMYGFYMDSQSGRSGNIPPISNRWGVYIADNGRNYFAGNVGIGTTTPSEKLHVSGNTKIDGGLTASTLNISSTPTTDTGTTVNYLTRDGSTGEVKVKTIPGSTVYGVFAQTGTSVAVSATTVESTLINNGIGTITVPANGFQVGDSFNGVLIGHLSCVGTATLQIRIKTTTGVLLADTGVISMNTATNKHWKLDVNFTIRQLGVASVGSIASGGLFSYTKNSGTNFEGTNFSIINNTTFDTTISNTLLVTAEWNTNNAGNSIYSEIFTLNKIY